MNTWVSFQSAEQPLLGQFSVSGNTGVTRDISDTGVFVELKDADKTFIEGELLTVQVSGLPAESTAVRGVAVRVSSNGLGVRLNSAKNALRTQIENQDDSQ
ncbi:PilZ domain-containing protein [Pseudomonas spirodelae]|uniref:PilZ domain-containing protein n=1 Tax=Pseudomonas spirodelae TaxID=3101751 RepID=A0ABU5P509_9PSED|nr:PilZ domain-containing protein [Pseudomonas sp. T5W1]MEA1604583.1 PilZ domain-containing protein [Pseudomonas sp. T5W1]